MADHSITIDVIGRNLQETVSLLKEIRDDIKTINSTPVTVKVNTANATRALNLLRQELGNVAQVLSQGNRNNSDAMMEALNSSVDAILSKLDELNSKSVSPSVDSSGIEQAASSAERLASGLDAASGIASSLSSVFSGLGDFGGMFADSFGAMSSMFKFDAVGTASRYLTAMATKAVTGQINGIIERYDIMNTFVPYMELAGVDAATAQASLDAVDQSIRGIPIGLDEAAFRLRKYQMYMNDIDRATNFTIGIQKAITAGGASEQMKTTAYTQIDRLLATGKLGQSRQWLSLFNGIGVSLRFLREELALDPTADLKTIASDLADGTIATDDFLRAIENLADNEGLDQAIEIYKGTIGAWRSNINNAIKRGGQNIMDEVNSVMKDTLGFGITGAMRMVRDGIDSVSKDAGNYIKDNPQHVQTISTAIDGLLERVMTLDGGRFVTNIVDNIGGIASAIGTVFDSLPPGFLEDFTSFAVTWAGPIATVMKAAQSGLPLVLGVFDRVKGMDMENLLKKITDEIGRMAGFVSDILGILPDGLLGDLMAFGLVWGKPLASVMGSISGALKDISGVVASGGSFSAASGIVGQLTSLAMSHPAITAAAVAIGAVALAIKSYKDAAEEWAKGNEILNVGDIDEITSHADNLIQTAEKSRESAEASIKRVESDAERAVELVERIKTLDKEIQEIQPLPYSDMDETRASKIQEMITDMEALHDIYPDLQLSADSLTGVLDEQSRAMLDSADAYIEYAKATAKQDVLKDVIREEADNLAQLEMERDYLEDNVKARQNYWRRVKNDRREAEAAVYNAPPNTAVEPPHGKSAVELGVAEEEALENYETAKAQLEEVNAQIEISEQTLDRYGKTLLSVRKSTLEFNSGTKTEAQYVVELASAFDELTDAARTALRETYNGFDEVESAYPIDEATGLPTVTAGTMISGLQSQETRITDYANAMFTIASYMAGLSEAEYEAFEPVISRVREQGEGHAEFAVALANSILGQGDAGVQAVVDAANGLETGLDKASLAEGLIDLLMTGNEEAARIIEENPDMFEDLNAAWSQGLLTQITELKESTGENSEVAQEMANIANQIFQPFEEKLNGVDGEGGLIADFSKAGEAITESLKNIAETAGSTLDPLTQGFDSAKSSADNLKTSISQVASTASNKSGEMQSFAGSLSSVTDSAFSAFSAVSNLAGAINNLHDKTITISVNMNAGGLVGSVGGFGAGLSSFGGVFAKGGLVDYLAEGGFPGIARGTDTIPAWLTPGEYVMKRSAVGMFGSRFMDRINKMDIGGAFDALMSRISNPMHMGGNTYNRDNHATVNNYFYGDNGQNYSQRKAYRYAGSL